MRSRQSRRRVAATGLECVRALAPDMLLLSRDRPARRPARVGVDGRHPRPGGERVTRHPGALLRRPGRRTSVSYLTRWRMDLAARRLRETTDSIDAVARDVAYTSEYACSRASPACEANHRGATDVWRNWARRLAASSAVLEWSCRHSREDGSPGQLTLLAITTRLMSSAPGVPSGGASVVGAPFASSTGADRRIGRGDRLGGAATYATSHDATVAGQCGEVDVPCLTLVLLLRRTHRPGDGGEPA
jgi:AraC-like DNA-binding protein